jgi:hypothetical protein
VLWFADLQIIAERIESATLAKANRLLIAAFGKPDFDRGCGYRACTTTSITVRWQPEIRRRATRKIAYLANHQLISDIPKLSRNIGSIKSRTGTGRGPATRSRLPQQKISILRTSMPTEMEGVDFSRHSYSGLSANLQKISTCRFASRTICRIAGGNCFLQTIAPS